MQAFLQGDIEAFCEVFVHLPAPAESHSRKTNHDQLSVQLKIQTSADRTKWIPNTLTLVSSGMVIVPSLGTAVPPGSAFKRCLFIGGNSCAFGRH